MECTFVFYRFYKCSSGSRGVGTGCHDPPEKSQKLKVYKQYWSGSAEKSQSYQASIQCWAIILASEPLFIRRFAVGPMMACLKWYFDPLTPHQLQ